MKFNAALVGVAHLHDLHGEVDKHRAILLACLLLTLSIAIVRAVLLLFFILTIFLHLFILVLFTLRHVLKLCLELELVGING